MSLSTLEKYLHTPFGELSVDKYINRDYIEHLRKNKRIGFYDKFGLGDLRFLTVKGAVRTLLGSSAAVERNKDRTGQLFLASHKQAMRDPEFIMPKSGWIASSSDSRKYRGIYKPKVKYRRPDKDKGWKRFSINTCPFAGQCKSYCLRATGNIQMKHSTRSRYLKTWFFYTEPLAFLRMLITEIVSGAQSARREKARFYLRLNGMSDIEWERFIYMDKLVKGTPGLIGFYDYTKHPASNRLKMAQRIPGGVPFPQHYRLIFSWDEKKETPRRASDWLRQGGSLSVVYPYSHRDEIKKIVRRNKFAVIGDEDDNRYRDRPNTIVFLKNKGALKEKSNAGTTPKQTSLLAPIPVLQRIVSVVERYRKPSVKKTQRNPARRKAVVRSQK